MKRENGIHNHYPVSCCIHSKTSPTGISAEVVNYHYAGACLKVADGEVFRLKSVIQDSLTVDFFFGSHLLKSGMPVRVAWHEPALPNLLGLQFLDDIRDFIERSRRYRVNDSFQPTIAVRDPLDIHRTIYFNVRNFSASGLLLNTSLTNKHLFPGMSLKRAILSIPGQKNLELDLKIQNARRGDSPNGFDLGVSVQSEAKAFRSMIQTYMNHLVLDAGIADSLDYPGDKRTKIELTSGLTFRIVSDESGYQDVLKLRFEGYGIKGKVKQGSGIQDQGEGLSNEGTILAAFLGGKIVASMELRFGFSNLPFRVFNFAAKSAFNHLQLDWQRLVEINKLVVHPAAQGTDVLIGMIQKAHAICMTKGAPDVMLFATDSLRPLYLRIGAQDTGVQFPHPYLTGVALHVLILTRNAFMDGRFMKAEVWSKYYESTNKFYLDHVYRNRSIAANKPAVMHKIAGIFARPHQSQSLSQKNHTYNDKVESSFIDPKWTKQHIAATVMMPYMLAGDRLIGVEKIDDILSEFGFSRTYFKSQNNWVSIEFLDAFIEKYRRFGSIDDVSKMSGKLTLDREIIGLNYYLLKHVLSPEIAFKAMTSAVNKFNRTRTFEAEMQIGRCIIRLGLVDRSLLPKHRCSDLNWLENIRAYINLLTNGRGEVKQLTSVYDGDPASVYEVTWPVRSARARLVLRAMGLISIAGAASGVVNEFFGPAAGAMAGVAAVAIVKWWEQAIENHQNQLNMTDVTRRIDDINEDSVRKYQELQNAKQRLDHRYLEAQLLDESARLIQSCESLSSINRTALQTVCKRFNFTRAFIMVVDDDKRTLKTVAIEGIQDGMDQLWNYRVDISKKRDGTLFMSSAFNSGQAVVINDLKSHFFQLNEQSQKLIQGLGGASGFTIVPIPDANGSCGVLVAERNTETHPICQDDIVVLQRLCQHIGIAIDRFSKLEKEQKLRTLFQKYVPQAVLDSLLKDAAPALGGVQREIVCMFLDIRGFTRLSASLPPKVVIDILNRVFAIVGRAVEQSHGVIDKFLGDGVLAVWGSVSDELCQISDIMQTIHKIKNDIEELSKTLVSEGLPAVSVGIGLHKGQAIVGNIGSVDRLEFTCIGNAVNLAARLEGLCKEYDCQLVISESTYPEAIESPHFKRIENVAIRGLEQKFNVFVEKKI